MTHPKLNPAGNPPTLDEYREFDLRRPLTCAPTGGSVGSRNKRALDAELSALVTPTLGFVPDPRAERLPEAPPRRKRGVQRTQIAPKPSADAQASGMET